MSSDAATTLPASSLTQTIAVERRGDMLKRRRSDEVGYLSYGPDAGNVLLQVVNGRYLHHRPMIFTINKPRGAWGRRVEERYGELPCLGPLVIVWGALW